MVTIFPFPVRTGKRKEIYIIIKEREVSCKVFSKIPHVG